MRQAFLAFALALMAAVGAQAQSLPQPSVITQPQNDNSSRAASTSYVDRSAKALSDALAGKAPLANPQFGGTVKADTLQILGSGSTGDASGFSARADASLPVASLSLLFQSLPISLPACRQATDPVGDWTLAFQRCVATGREISVPAGIFSTRTVVINTGSTIRGAGKGFTTIKLLNGANADLIQTQGAYSLFGTASSGGARRWTLADMTLDGNRANQTATGAAIDAVNCIAAYGDNWDIQNVTITQCKGHGIRSEWSDAGFLGGMEAGLHNVVIDVVGRHGWWFKGPHDTNASKLMVIDAGQEADNTYDGIRVEGNANGRFIDIHPWHRSGVTNRMRCAFSSAGSNQIISSHLEGGRSQLCHNGNYDQVIGSYIYAPYGAPGSALVTFGGNNNTHVGNQYQGTNGLGSNYALQIGVAGKSVVYNRISEGQFVGFGEVGPFNFVNDGGANSISGSGYANPGGVSTITGTVAGSTRINYNQGGTPINLSSTPTVAQPATGTVAGGNARGSGAVDFQTSRTAAANVAAGTNTGILSGSDNVIGANANASVIAGGTGSSTGNSNYAFVGGGLNNYAIAANASVLGGQNNSASGIQSGVAYGSNNAADGFASTANGIWATARGLQAANALASGRFAAAGDAQRREVVLRAAVTTTSPTRLTADGGAGATSTTITLPDNSAFEMSCKMVARSTTSQDAAVFTLDSALLTRGAGAATISLVGGSWTAGAASAGASGKLTASVAANTTLGSALVTLTATSGTWNAVARCTTTEAQ